MASTWLVEIRLRPLHFLPVQGSKLRPVGTRMDDGEKQLLQLRGAAGFLRLTLILFSFPFHFI